MAEINPKMKNGKVVAYFVRANLGRDETGKKIRQSTVIERPVDRNGNYLTPKKEEKEIKNLADNWEKEQRIAFEKKRETISQVERKEKKTITLPEFIDKHWMPKKVNGTDKTPDTIEFYTHISNIIKAFFVAEKPKLRLSEICAEDIDDFLRYLRNDAKKKNGEPYGKTTIKHCYDTLRNIINYAKRTRYYFDDNPCMMVETKPQRESTEIVFLNGEEATDFLSCIDSEKEIEWWDKNHHRSNLMWKCLCNILITVGLRRGEAVGLRWCDIDKNLMLHVRQNVTPDNNHKDSKNPMDKIHIGKTKGKDNRSEPISPAVYDMLMEYKKEQEERFNIKFISSKDIPVNSTSYIFCRATDLNTPLYPTTPTKMMKKFIERHDLKNISPHDLRHTSASLAVEAGAQVKDIQGLMGHKDPATTLKFYAALTEKVSRRTNEGIESLIRPKMETDSKAE